MRDAHTPTLLPPPAGWGDAFAALPMEAPPAGGWPRVAAALDARERNRWQPWLAIAAALALVALLPLSRQAPQVDNRTVAASAPSGGAGGTSVDGKAAPTARSDDRDSRAGAGPAPPTVVASRTGTATAHREPHDRTSVAVAHGVRAQPRMTARLRADADRRHPERIATASAARGRNAAAQAQRRNPARGHVAAAGPASTPGMPVAGRETDAPGQLLVVADAATASVPDTSASTTSELDRLHAESAQLEALVALARDDRISTGTVAALGGELETRVARIDAALVEPSVAAAQKLDLWRERVEALRALAGFETTQRLLAARGEQYDAMLVSVD